MASVHGFVHAKAKVKHSVQQKSKLEMTRTGFFASLTAVLSAGSCAADLTNFRFVASACEVPILSARVATLVEIVLQ